VPSRVPSRAPTRRAPRPHRSAGPGAWRSGRDSQPAPASRTPRSSPRAARTAKPPRRSCASPPRRDRRTFAGDYSSRRRLRNTAERRPPWCANAPYISSSRGTDTTRGASGRTLFGVTPRRYPCISTAARRRRRSDRRVERREAPRRGVRVQTPRRSSRRDGVARPNIFTSRSGDRLRTRVRSSPRKSISGDCWSARGANPRRRNPPTSASISTSRGAPPTPPPPPKKTKLKLDWTDLHRTGSNRRRTRTSVCLFPSSTRATFACIFRTDTATPSRRPRAARCPRARRGPRRVGRAWRRTDWFPPGYRGAARRGWINPGRRARSSAACAPPARRLAWTFDSETRSRFRLT